MQDSFISSSGSSVSGPSGAASLSNGQNASTAYVKGLLENKRAELLDQLDKVRGNDNSNMQQDFVKLKLKKIDQLINYANDYYEARRAMKDI